MLVQLLLNALIGAATLSLMAAGFGLIFHVARFFHFAHGAVFTLGAYLVLFFKESLDLPSVAAFPMGVLGAVMVGCAMELAVYRPLRRRSASSLTLLIASLGIYIVLQNVVSLIWGDSLSSIRGGLASNPIEIGSGRITTVQLVIMVISSIALTATYLVLRLTRIGKLVRAVANDPDLAVVVGVRSDRVILMTFAIGSALAGLAGVLSALDVDMTPAMGMNALLLGIVGVIVGGLGSLPGAVLGVLLVSSAQHLGIWKLPSQWQDCIAFVILIVFLLFRPQGFRGLVLLKTRV